MRGTPLEEGLRWLEQAEIDLGWAEHLSEQGGYHLACFLAQQVAEKALKALLYAQGEEVVIGHSVARLCNRVAESDPSLSERCWEWSALDAFYVPTRYPDALPGSIPGHVYTAAIASEAVRLAGEVVGMIATRLRPSSE